MGCAGLAGLAGAFSASATAALKVDLPAPLRPSIATKIVESRESRESREFLDETVEQRLRYLSRRWDPVDAEIVVVRGIHREHDDQRTSNAVIGCRTGGPSPSGTHPTLPDALSPFTSSL
jgi:hypothetical protein